MKFRPKGIGKIATLGAQDKLFTCRAVFPFDFFPDSITLDEAKLTITRRGLFTKTIIPIKLHDLLNVEVHEAPLFCAVEIVAKFVTARHEKVMYIRKRDAHELQRKCLELIVEKTGDTSGGQ